MNQKTFLETGSALTTTTLPPIVCVLKSGGRYGPDDVKALATNIRRFDPERRIICLSDLALKDIAVERIPLKHELEGWFSKLEIFALREPAFLYLDLDVVVTGRIETTLKQGLYLLRDFGVGAVNSSVMYVRGNYHSILDRFLSDPKAYSAEYAVKGKWGDQDFIRDHANITGYLQDLEPGLAASWKRDLHYRMGWLPHPPVVLVFHGHPKPTELTIQHDQARGLFLFSWRFWPKSLLKRLFS